MRRLFLIPLFFLAACGKTSDYPYTAGCIILNRSKSPIQDVVVGDTSTRYFRSNEELPAKPLNPLHDEFNSSSEKSDPLPYRYVFVEFKTMDGQVHKKRFVRWIPWFFQKPPGHILFVVKEGGDVIAKLSRHDKFKDGAYPEPRPKKMDAETVRWIRKAAQEGYADAQNNLGNAYFDGEGVGENPREAVKWFRLAAEQEYGDSEFSLGYAYNVGKGVPVDFAQAMSWYRKAADRGDQKSQYSIAMLYANGQGVPQDYSQAYFWVVLSASSGVPAAAELQHKIAATLDATTRLKIEKEASRWKPSNTF